MDLPPMQRLAEWLMGDNTGASSKFMASIYMGARIGYGHHPCDPSDLNRCILLCEAVPEVREAFPRLAQCSQQWNAIVENWDTLINLFQTEAGENWSRSFSAPKTYNKMKEIFKQ